MGEAVEPNRSGPGCHDTETGHPATCQGGGKKVKGAAADPARHTAAQIWGKEPTDQQRDWHRGHVEDALSRGEPVPAAVLAEHPGLTSRKPAVRADALAGAYRAIAEEPANARLGGIVRVPELFDALRQSHPGLTREQFHAELARLQGEGLLTLQVVNDPHLEPRAAEMPRDAQGALRGYVLIKPAQRQTLLNREGALDGPGGVRREAGVGGTGPGVPGGASPPEGERETPPAPPAAVPRRGGVAPPGTGAV